VRALLLLASALLCLVALIPARLTRGQAAPVVRVAAAGDIACDSDCGQDETAALLERGRYDGILALGDLQYGGATLDLFRRWYGTSWGRPALKAVTHPAPGNHEYEDDGASGYFAYFGGAAGRAGRGWYGLDLGAWHVVALNSSCDEVGGCDRGSPQERWLRSELARSRRACTLAFWHHPRFSSGLHGDDRRTTDLWADLAAAHAEIVLSGHDHDYERFAPRDGIREFVVGTGGKSHYPLLPLRRPGSQAGDDDHFGILELTLRARSYEWRFLRTDGRVGDRGEGRCA
jgi:acid phosphatase type 7